MCISELKKFTPCRVGYKVMKEKDGELFSEFAGKTDKPRPLHEWLDESDFRDMFPNDLPIYICTGKSVGQTYPKGWHIFNRKSDAKYWADPAIFGNLAADEVTVRVLVREPVATGYEHYRRVTVAKYIKIMGKV